MAKPQDPGLRRSGEIPALDPDAMESELEGRDRPPTGGPTGPVPPGNRSPHEIDDGADRQVDEDHQVDGGE